MLRRYALALLASTAMTSVAIAQQAQAPAEPAPAAPAAAAPAATTASATVPAKPADFGKVYAPAPVQPVVTPVVKPNPKPETDYVEPKPAKKIVAKQKSAPAPTAAPGKAPVGTGQAAAGTGTGNNDNAVNLSSDAAVGSGAPSKSAPALAPSQQSLNAIEPGSTVSDKVLRDIAQPTSDYNEAPKYTPGFVSQNPNGPPG